MQKEVKAKTWDTVYYIIYIYIYYIIIVFGYSLILHIGSLTNIFKFDQCYMTKQILGVNIFKKKIIIKIKKRKLLR